MTDSIKELDMFFYPESVAVVGASTDPRKTGNALINNLIKYGYRGKIYPVNPGADEILGIKTVKNLTDIPGGVDLAVFTIPAEGVVKVLGDSKSIGIKAAVVHSAGFAEAGEEGKRLQRELVKVAREHGTRLVGPNCMGVMCPESRLPWSRRTTFPEQPGEVAVISQSGGGGGSFVNLADERGIKFSKIVTIGNECDVTVIDFIEYLGGDEKTKIIFIYLEGFRDGNRFVKIAQKVSATKPIIIYKIGRTSAGGRAAASHTGSIAGSIQVYEGVFKQTGVIRAEGIDEALDYIVAFSNVWFKLGIPQGNRVGVVTGPGGPGVATVDACIESGLEVPDITEESKITLAKVLPGVTRRNPMDMADFSFVASLKEKDPYGIMVGIMAEDKNIDIIAIMGPGEANPGGFRDVVLNIHKTCKKPFVVIWPSAGKEVEECKKVLVTEDIPLFMTPERAAKALSALMRYKKMIKKL